VNLDNFLEDDGQDGFADAMSKILGQSVKAKVWEPFDRSLNASLLTVLCDRFCKNPVMAKRTTETMKNIEDSRAEIKQAKEAQVKKKETTTKNMVMPSAKTMVFERMLRSIATKGGSYNNAFNDSTTISSQFLH
jgi:hypothetical protein